MLSAYARNPMWFLRNFSDTLYWVSVTHSTCALVGAWYPHVTSLHLRFADLLHTCQYVRAFPNLQVLSTDDCNVFKRREEYEPRRACNIMEQAEFGTWTYLSSYHGSFVTLYLLGITQCIPTLVIDHAENDLEPQMLRTVLGDARPRRFEFSLDSVYWILDSDFWPTFTYDGVDALRYFKLELMLSTLDETTDIHAVLVSDLSRNTSVVSQAVF